MARAQVIFAERPGSLPLLRYLDRRMSLALSHAVQISDPANNRRWDEWIREQFSTSEGPQPEPKSEPVPPKSPPSTKSPPTKSPPRDKKPAAKTAV
jgi:hypothetical protein